MGKYVSKTDFSAQLAESQSSLATLASGKSSERKKIAAAAKAVSSIATMSAAADSLDSETSQGAQILLETASTVLTNSAGKGKEYNEAFFKQLDTIENNILDGQSLNDAAKNSNLSITSIKKINAKKEDESKNKIKNLSDNLFKKIYNLKSINSPEVINLDNKYYIAEIFDVDKKNRTINDPEVQQALNAQLSFKTKIENNTSIIKDISMGALDKEKFKKFALDNKLEIKDYKIDSLKQNEIFSEGIIKRIFLTDDGKIDLITNNTLTKNFLVLGVSTNFKDLKKGSNKYEQYEAKARLNLINKIFQSHDNKLNQKYNVELNKKTIERVKNSF